MQSSVTLSYSKSFTTLSSLDGVVCLRQPISFIPYRGTEKPRRMSLRLIQVSFTSRIANVYSLPDGSFNNGLIRVSKDGGATWTSIQLPDGVYTLPYIQAAINEAVSAWWTTSSDPGFVLRYNLATEYAYVSLDSTKLAAPGQLGIDFSQSRVADLLGYSAVKTFVADGTHVADAQAMLNWCGDAVSVYLRGFGTLSVADGVLSEELCSIPLTVSQVGNEYIYPSASITTDTIDIDPLASLTEFTVEFKGSRRDASDKPYPVYATDGAVKLIFKLSWFS